MLTSEAFAAAAYPILVVVFLAVFVRAGGQQRPRVLCLAVFSVYLVEVLRLTLFPIPVDGSMARSFAGIPFFTHSNPVPLTDLLQGRADASEVIRNVALGVPFGFGGWFVLRRPSAARVLAAGSIAFVAVELLQLAIGWAVGFMYRVVDINDVILNAAGVAVGVGAFLVFARLWRALDRGAGQGGGANREFLRSVTGRAAVSVRRPR